MDNAADSITALTRATAKKIGAQAMCTDGPLKMERTNRRIRAQLCGQWIVDTLDALYVWENKYYPMYYVPLAAIRKSPAVTSKTDNRAIVIMDAINNFEHFGTGSVIFPKEKDKEHWVPAIFFHRGPLDGYARLDKVDWYAEDEKLIGSHPKDPYVRIECLSSSRSVRVELNGIMLAESSNNVFLHETNLRARHYLSPTAANHQYLRRSTTTTFCPYKGQASYYDVVLPDGTEVKDGVWYYPFPTHESAAIQGRLAFYNEKFDVFVDGVKEDK
ncbi:hypothetical protein SEUCBS139899_007571 [Sporothrix eucalyptigena]|uniref:DUF427 domain-containing protein n=1 Tax=Sporothrix eucalyptigena TaxID=1812306 RepID=A0ABP0C1Q1_9PEZI